LRVTVPPAGKSDRGEEGMALFTVAELREVISVKVLAGDPSPTAKRRIRGISTDSRSIRRGDLFVALRGDRFDGHQFIPAVLAKGAAGAIVHDGYRWEPKKTKSIGARNEPFVFGVMDPLFAYQQLATHHRSRFAIPIVAVTTTIVLACLTPSFALPRGTKPLSLKWGSITGDRPRGSAKLPVPPLV
jgi:hypothetical protein